MLAFQIEVTKDLLEGQQTLTAMDCAVAKMSGHIKTNEDVSEKL